MKEFVISRRYASALLMLSKETGDIDGIRKDLLVFKEVVAGNRKLFQWLIDERIPSNIKIKLIIKINEVLQLSDIIIRFAMVLIKRGRLQNLEGIIRLFCDMADGQQNIARGVLLAAKRTSVERIKTSIEKNLSKRTGKKVVLDMKEDPSLIGGFAVKMAHSIYDASIKRKLDELREKICR